MTGVEILNETVIYVHEYSFAAFIIPVIVFAIIGAVFLWWDARDIGDVVSGLVLGGMLGILVGLFFCVVTATPTKTVDYIKYQVTISDEVNFNEFTDKYKILEQEGKIYTVRERNEVDS